MKKTNTQFEILKSETTTKQRRISMNTNNIVRKTAAFALLGMCAAIMPLGAQTVWQGTVNNDWNTAGNWSNGLPSGSGRSSILKTANVTMSNTGGTNGVTVSAVGTSFDDAAVLNISWNLNSIASVDIGANLTDNSYAKVVHTSGRLTATGLNIGTTNAFGLYEFGGAQSTAPVLSVSGTVRVGSPASSNGIMSLKDYGTVTVGRTVVSANNSPGELWVKGGNLDINVGGNLEFALSAGADGVLKAIIDNTGFSTINVTTDVRFGTTSNRSRFVLELGSGYAHVPGTEFVILNAGGNFTDFGVFGQVNGASYTAGDIFTVDGNEFSAAYLTGDSSQFVVTAIPEPSSLLLLGLAGLAGLAMMRRRKR